MSKSLGNGVDPRDIVHSHGADALRFTMVQMATSTQDVRLPVDMVSPHCDETFHPKEITSPQGYRVAAPVQKCPKTGKEIVSGYGAASGQAQPSDDRPLARNTSPKFDLGRNFCNKLWNATRFALSNLKDADPGDPDLAVDELGLLDRWILSRLRHTVDAINCAVGAYQFNVYADQMYDFVWRDFCDWHLEAVKPTIRNSREQQQVLRTVLSAIVRMLHPIAPFVTETLWPSVRATGDAGVRGVDLPDGDVLALTAWPVVDESLADDDAEATFERAQNLVNAIRGLRAKNNVGPKKKITLSATTSAAALVEATGEVVPTLAGLEQVLRVEDGRPADALPLAFEGDELLLSGLVDAVDVDAERQRLTKLIAEKGKAAKGYRGKLSNEGYVNNAPANVVEETRQRLAEAEADLSAAEQALKAL
ncbi:MAG: class I tRNA ligase family protein, partial [Pseudomonadales bacterium]|nr:class I tRNA ligase family protein [Pseudomonadales bacterium]